MSKNIRTSNKFFDSLNQPLGKRQPAGSMPKREAAAVNLAAVRLLKRDTFRLGGLVGEHSRRGFENVYDAGVSRERLYCVKCGTMSKDEAEENCRICKASFILNPIIAKHLASKGLTARPALSTEKFSLVCGGCDLPFHINGKIKAVEADFKEAVGYRSDVCGCFIDAKAKFTADLSRDRKARKAARKLERQAVRSEHLTACQVELNNLRLIDKTGLSRSERHQLHGRERYLLKELSLI